VNALDGRFDMLDVMGRVEAIDGRFGMLDVMGRVMASDITVYGSLEMDGYRANFENAQEVRVPTPDQDNEATNKAYVDSLVGTSIASDNARGLVQLAVTENVSNISEYYLTYEGSEGATNPVQGDLVLLTGQTTASENGIYEVSSVNLSSSSSGSSEPTASDYYVSLTRASNFDSADEFVTGSFVFVEKGAQLGQGYVLGELASEFALGTSALNYIQFTVDTTSDVAFDQSVSASSLTTGGDLSVSGNSTFSGNSSFDGTSTFDGTLRSMGMLEVMGPAMMGNISTSNISASDIDASDITAHGTLKTYGMLEVSGDIEFNGYRANFENAQEVRVPTPDQDNEATNKAYVDAAVGTNATAITAEATTARAAELVNATAITTEATARASAITAAVSGDINASSLTTSGDLLVSGAASLGSLSLGGLATFEDINVGYTASFGSDITIDPYYGYSAYNSEMGTTSYIGRDPSSGNYGNRLVGTTIIDNLNVGYTDRFGYENKIDTYYGYSAYNS
jgi:hypothetical protein